MARGGTRWQSGYDSVGIFYFKVNLRSIDLDSVWGGGVYEDDAFYDACDELGLLVWQDFMFACGNYPCTPDLLASIRDEAKVQVGRLRNHPSVVLYCGNNEDYQIREFSGLTYEYEDKDPENWLKTNFPARYIYEKADTQCP